MNMTFWKTFWASLIASVVSGILIIILFFIILNAIIASFGSAFEENQLKVKENTVLHMTLNSSIGDRTYADIDQNSFQVVEQFGLVDILDGLKMAKEDDKIKGIFLNCDRVPAGMATVKELRDGLADFQESGKFLLAYHENYNQKAYYLSSVADELYVFPSGMLEFLGLGTELMFLKGALEKLDVEMQIIRGSNNRFKSAVEPLLYDRMSEANRLQTQLYLDALWDVMLDGISDSRGIEVGRLNEIADSVFVRQSGDAVAYKMADGIKYYDEVLDLLEEKAGTPPDSDEIALLSFEKYALKKTKEERTLNKLETKNLAVIFAEGEIVDGSGSINQIGGNRTAALIREARLDEDIKGIVLRVNSPGGSALASDIIWREVDLTVKAEKPIMVSMGDLAASGGYYISCAADKIYAQPNTLTGSIGVFGVIPYTGDLFKNKLGVTFDRVQTNTHSVVSINKKLGPDELDIIQQGVDDIYDDFIDKVAKGRGLTVEMVDSIGQGRVWAGADAMEIGLIDAYGGIQDVIDDVAQEAGLEKDSVRIRYYPKTQINPFIEFMESFEEQGEEDEVAIARVQNQVVDIYNYLKTIGSTQQIQARLPYLYWIE